MKLSPKIATLCAAFLLAAFTFNSVVLAQDPRPTRPQVPVLLAPEDPGEKNVQAVGNASNLTAEDRQQPVRPRYFDLLITAGEDIVPVGGRLRLHLMPTQAAPDVFYVTTTITYRNGRKVPVYGPGYRNFSGGLKARTPELLYEGIFDAKDDEYGAVLVEVSLYGLQDQLLQRSQLTYYNGALYEERGPVVRTVTTRQVGRRTFVTFHGGGLRGRLRIVTCWGGYINDYRAIEVDSVSDDEFEIESPYELLQTQQLPVVVANLTTGDQAWSSSSKFRLEQLGGPKRN